MVEPVNSSTEDAKELSILPRNAWNDRLVFLKVILKAKLALDRIERENISPKK
jgi:hypothetical protein